MAEPLALDTSIGALTVVMDGLVALAIDARERDQIDAANLLNDAWQKAHYARRLLQGDR
jgi:hypothetical protein